MLTLGLFASATALGCLVFALLASPVARISIDRRGTEEVLDQTLLTQFSDGVTKGVDRLLRRHGWTLFSAQEIELAGLAISQSSLLVTVVSLSFTTLVFGALIIQNIFLELLLAVMVPVGAKMLLKVKSSRRRRAFGEQLDSSLQMLSSALRAGHSFPRAIDAVSQEAESPISEEFSRVVNENRIGRDIVEAMRQTATRMRNEDFGWVADAVAIQRDTGGNLSEILDRVGGTIRERNEIRAQIHALSAEGRMSAGVLMALPVVVGGVYVLMNPAYMAPLFFTLVGQILLGISVGMYIVAALWLRVLIKVKF